MSVTAATDREVFLKTSDGKTVVTTLAIISKSAVLKDAAAACIAKGAKIEVDLPSISEVTLHHVIEWLVHHIDEPSLVPERGTPISEWDEDLIARIPLQPERVDLLNAADYLKILPLSDLMISIFARRVNEHRNVDRIAKKLERLHAYSMRFEAQRIGVRRQLVSDGANRVSDVGSRGLEFVHGDFGFSFTTTAA
ncbi:hypothetical protein H9P43_002959 [Blastocladiella emersonii ATCC 22665]|nr:hypothetical protein H9P43_002959 [Blastocladiella emersonii ATCC 22665]